MISCRVFIRVHKLTAGAFSMSYRCSVGDNFKNIRHQYRCNMATDSFSKIVK